MGQDSVKDPTVVTAREHLEEVVAELKGALRLAVDTESNGFYAYQEKVCLIQLSSSCDDFIIDPIAIKDLSALGPLLEDPRIEKIFHAGEYDVLCLKRDYGFRFANIFDTMVASRILGFKELGLAAAIERHFGVKLSKKLQRADWGLRPLSSAQIRYAQMDTHYLMRLADIQKELLLEKERLEDAAEAFQLLAELEPSPRCCDQEAFWRLAGRHNCTAAQLSCLREIYFFREEQARSRDRAPFRVMPEDLMLRLARLMPADLEQLAAVAGMSPYLIQKFGKALLACIERGKASPPPAPPPRPSRQKRDGRQWKLFEDLRRWRKAQADREGLDPVCIISSEQLRRIAEDACRNGDPLKCLSDLKRRRYGQALMALLQTKNEA